MCVRISPEGHSLASRGSTSKRNLNGVCRKRNVSLVFSGIMRLSFFSCTPDREILHFTLCENIRILHECQVMDRQICPEGHSLASRGSQGEITSVTL